MLEILHRISVKIGMIKQEIHKKRREHDKEGKIYTIALSYCMANNAAMKKVCRENIIKSQVIFQFMIG